MTLRPSLAVPLTAGAVLAALAVLVVADWAPLAGWDAAASARARAYGQDHPTWVATLRVVTELGATLTLLVAGGALTIGLLRCGWYAAGAGAGLVTVLVPAVWNLAHATLHRPRPVDGFVNSDSNGFPSGHTTNATALALLGVLLLWPRLGRAGRIAAVTAAALMAGSVGVTRVALLAHWPSDVLGGWLLGIAMVPLCMAAAARHSRKLAVTRSPSGG